MRKLWRTRQPGPPVGLVDRTEFGALPLVLVWQFLPRRWGRYRTFVQVRVRDGGIERVIRAHRLDALDVYVDDHAKVLAKERDAHATKAWAYETSDTDRFKAGLGWIASSVAHSRSIHLSLGQLMAGVETSGTLLEQQAFVQRLSQSIDQINRTLATAFAFTTGEVRVVAPGKPPQTPVTTAPSRWRR